MTEQTAVIDHYGHGALVSRLKEALKAAGLDGRTLGPAELAPLDQFHTRGLMATTELAAASGVTAGAMVIDIGSGLGGPSRYLAATFGCQVRGIDLSPAFVEAAAYLSDRAGLQGKVSYQCADALSLPHPDKSFDLAWTQHVAMNIADRARLYAEAYRVLRPGGRFAIYDVVAGTHGPLHFPVPWSRDSKTSFLLTAAAMRVVLEQQGFRVLSWSDRTDEGITWFAEQQKARAQAATASAPTLGLHLAMGREFPTMTANLGRNLREGRVGLVQAVLERPPAG